MLAKTPSQPKAPAPVHLMQDGEPWVAATPHSLSLEEKIGQMLQGRSFLYFSFLQGMLLPPQKTTPAKRTHPPDQPPALVGTKVCAECHSSEAATQIETPMAHAGKLAADSEVLRTNTDMTVRVGPYHYQIRYQGGRAIYSVSDGNQTISVPLLLALGDGVGGHTVFTDHFIHVAKPDEPYPQENSSSAQHP